MWPKGVELKHWYPASCVPDHEVYLAFNEDDEAIAFVEWLQEVGWGKFHNWKTLQ